MKAFPIEFRGAVARRCALRLSSTLAAALVAGGVLHCGLTRALRSGVDDAAISASIRARVLQDGELNPLLVFVATDEGEAYLIGRAPTEEAILRAEDYARAVSGVWSVINHLRIGERSESTAQEDAAMQAEIEQDLRRNPDVSSLAVKAIVYERSVYLIGRVKDEIQRNEANSTAFAVDGVRRVFNYLKAGPLPES